MATNIKTFTACYRYYRRDGVLDEIRQEILTTSLKDAKITAKREAEQQGYWLVDLMRGSWLFGKSN